MIRKKKSGNSSPNRMLHQWIEAIPGLRNRLPSAPTNIKHVGTLIDVFSAFATLDGHVDASEANVALDLLRHAFPEADHGWLARRFHRALKSSPELTPLAQNLKETLKPKERIALGLQLFLLVDASTQRVKGLRAFESFMTELGESSAGAAILAELDASVPCPAELPFESLSFAGKEVSGKHDIRLADDSADTAFSVYRCNEVFLIRNTGDCPLTLSGHSIPANAICRFRAHQRIHLPSWTVGRRSLQFFFDAKYQGDKRTLYLSETEHTLIAERNKSRLSVIKLTFGISAKIEVLHNTRITYNGDTTLELGDKIDADIHGHISLPNGNRITLDNLRYQALEAGGRFKLDHEKQTCRISNDPNEIKRGDLLVSPGLADKFVLEVSYDQSAGTGSVEVLQSGKTPITVNGSNTGKSATLQDGALIRVSNSQGIRCRLTDGILDEERTVIQELRVDGVSHRFTRNQKVLDNIDFTVSRGETMCIIGPSGSGKSTLLSTLAGQLAPSRGHVRLNEISLYQQRKRLAPFITYMPQEEALNPNLRVREHLQHAIAIRQPHLEKKEADRRVDAILDELSLQPLAYRKVGGPGEKALSGGERSRLNLGLDLGSQAEIFLFDEPISGLSSKDAEHVAEALRLLSRDKIVIASLHRPGALVLKHFDKVLLLDTGGRVAFFGSPTAMFKYFHDACSELKINTTLQHSEDGMDQGADFVFDVLETPMHEMVSGHAFSSSRRFPPLFWQERFESYQLIKNVESGEVPAQTNLGDMPRAEDNMPIPRPAKRRVSELITLFYTHFTRSFLSKLRNKGTFYSTILEAPLLSCLIAITLRASADGKYAFEEGLNIIHYLFLTATVGMFLGLTNSATEILRDQPILRRERNCRFSVSLYISSKFLSLSLLAVIQCAIYTTIGHYVLEIKDMWLPHWIWMSITAICGTGIAMFISSIVKSERAALSSIPLLLVPQLLLAGALIPFGNMNRGLFMGGDASRDAGAEPVPARLMPLRYAYEGMIVSQATKNPFEKYRTQIQSTLDALKEKPPSELTEADKERIEILKEGLTRLVAAEALSLDDADKLCAKLVDTSINKSMDELISIPVYVEEQDEAPSCRSYFINSRVELLFREAESQRTDYRNREKPNIFLAEKKYWWKIPNPEHAEYLETIKRRDENSINAPLPEEPPKLVRKEWSTTLFCRIVIIGTTLASMLLTILVIRRWNNKVK